MWPAIASEFQPFAQTSSCRLFIFDSFMHKACSVAISRTANHRLTQNRDAAQEIVWVHFGLTLVRELRGQNHSFSKLRKRESS